MSGWIIHYFILRFKRTIFSALPFPEMLGAQSLEDYINSQFQILLDFIMDKAIKVSFYTLQSFY